MKLHEIGSAFLHCSQSLQYFCFRPRQSFIGFQVNLFDIKVLDFERHSLAQFKWFTKISLMLCLISAIQLSVDHARPSVCGGGQAREVRYWMLVTVNGCRATVWAEWGEIWGYSQRWKENGRALNMLSPAVFGQVGQLKKRLSDAKVIGGCFANWAVVSSHLKAHWGQWH